ALELRAQGERVSGVNRAQVFQRKRLRLGFNVELQIPKGSPPERTKQAMRAAIADEPVFIAYDLFAFDLVAVALLSALEQSFGISELYLGAAPAARDKLRISCCEICLI